MKRDHQALLFRFTDGKGPEVPVSIEGWRLESYSIEGDPETGLFALARYYR